VNGKMARPIFTTGSIGAASRRATYRQARHAVRVTIYLFTPHQLALSLHQTQLQHLGLNLDVRRVGFRAVGDAALIKRKAIAVTLDHASASSLPM
jgi:hypothetical protein